jgi:hypothetical protein
MRQQHQHVLNERTLDSRLTLKLKTLNKKKTLYPVYICL